MTKRFRDTKPRLKGWDYSHPGLYFITLVSYGQQCLFGKIQSEQMIYSPLGEIVKHEWLRSFDLRDELFCHGWVIMPNHLHAIVRLSLVNTEKSEITNPGVAYRPPRSISSFVAGFKSSVTVRINQYRNTPKAPVWQERFHDHIIRDEAGYQEILKYIENNPRNWNDDRFHCR